MPQRRYSLAACIAFALIASGCAGAFTQRLVDLRTSQGDAALTSGSLEEADKEYALALKLDPHNGHARSGLARVLYLQARASFIDSKLEDAQVEISGALRYAPQDAAAQALSAQIDQAKIRREIVLANYPLYGTVGASLTDSLKTLGASQHEIALQLKSFRSDFDSAHLTKAIVAAYALQDEEHRLAQRIIEYRSLVTSGEPKAKAPEESQAPNLLPVP